MKKLKQIPRFKSEAEEREFWATHDSSDYIDWSQAERNVSFPNLKPTTKPISIRLPEYMIENLKEKANEIDIPYQSLIKTYIKRGLQSPL